MNRDTIIGFVLIALVLIGFSWWNQPSAEQIEAARMQDSIAQVQKDSVLKAQQQAAAKEEIGKPFPFEDDLRVKSARLVELDTLLNIDGKGHAQPETVVAKSARPSVLDSLKRPVPPRSPEKKPKQHEEVR